ncbi:hypothetical protein L211DRAFT_527791 [Terfezia boudieri ATCC MYA-4762]|uniref:Uncharacterized protein n=1 Tax=Terfezia boudieri ATCC MYA-4762 TaxID=1051890 RepID=A0A3N4LBQ1_9PEZI|nr:hypothetical protein L211DRAFT_527791 [Terfezia boudieri ATCC MYA-4762]
MCHPCLHMTILVALPRSCRGPRILNCPECNGGLCLMPCCESRCWVCREKGSDLYISCAEAPCQSVLPMTFPGHPAYPVAVLHWQSSLVFHAAAIIVLPL